MPLPSAGNPISFGDINDELNNNTTDTLDLKTASEAFSGGNVQVAPYGMDELQGGSFVRVLQSIGYLDYESQAGDPSYSEDTAVPYLDGDLHLAAGAENVNGDITAIDDNYYNSDGGFSNGDILYKNSTGLTFPDFPNPPGASGLTSDGYLVNKTSHKVFFYTRSTSAVSNVIDRTPATMVTPTIAKVGNDIVVTISNHETRVTKEYEIQRNVNGGSFSTLTTISPSAKGNYSNTSVTTTYTDTTVSAGNTYGYKVRAKNAYNSTAYVNSSPTTINIPTGTTISYSNVTSILGLGIGTQFDTFYDSTENTTPMSVTISNGSGTTDITKTDTISSQTRFAWSTSGDPNPQGQTTGTSNGGSGWVNSATGISGNTIYLRVRVTEGSRAISESGTMTFSTVNNSITQSQAINISISNTGQ